MVWQGPRTAHDQSLSSKGWARVKAYWIRQRIPSCQATVCLLPGVLVDYEPPYTKPTSFNCGHVVPRWRAKALGWTIDQINSIGNSRPEHRLCNLRDGARIGQRRQSAKLKRPTRVVSLDYSGTADRW
jgi:hypothetical protein